MIIRHYFLNNEFPYGKAQKAGKGEGWAPRFNSCAQYTVGL